jgi:hypothetical protein
MEVVKLGPDYQRAIEHNVQVPMYLYTFPPYI